MDTVKKVTRLFILLSLFALVAKASPQNYCNRSELQFFNTYASSIINPLLWTPTSSLSVLFGYVPMSLEETTQKENFLVKFVFHAKSDQHLILRGDVHQVEENKRSLCWKTTLYFSYDLTNPGSIPEITTAEGVSVPFIGENLNFKSCEILSRSRSTQSLASHNEVVAGTTEEGDKYTFWMTYAKPNSILKAVEGRRVKNSKTVFFETVGLNN